MPLTADQELRKELLLFALSRQSDVKAAMELATQMVHFVLDGYPPPTHLEQTAAIKGQDGETAPPGVGDANPTSDCFAQSETPSGASVVRKRRWSAEDDLLLKRLWRSESSLDNIAAEMDRTVPSLYSRARALGMSKRPQSSPRQSGEPQDRSGPADAGREGSRAGSSGIAAAASNDRRQVIRHQRYRFAGQVEAKTAGETRRGIHRPNIPSSSSADSGDHPLHDQADSSLDSIIQFLRSRDYSVVRTEEGRFRLDGRHVLDADELREKANQLRVSLGQPPFAGQVNETHG